MKREENWNHLKDRRSLKAYDNQMARINKNLGTDLTGEQHTALMVLAQYRHYIHKARVAYGKLDRTSKDNIKGFFLNQMSIMLRAAKLPELNIRFFPIDHIKDEELRTIYIDDFNEAIEEYLSSIDKAYGTMYCPTGFRRLRRKKKEETLVL